MRLVSIENRKAAFIEVFCKTAKHQGYDLVLAAPNPTPSPAFEAFAAAYQHFSDNPYDFELNCFRRYFEALEYAEPGGAVIISDTDQLILSPPKDLPEIFFDTGTLVGSRGTTNGVAESDISPHFSKWPTELLQQFVDFLIQIYREKPEILEEEYKKRRLGKGRAAVSDMTLLNLFVASERVPFSDSNSLKFDHYVDHNFSMSDASDGAFLTEFGFKAFRQDRSGHIDLIAANGDRVRPASLHLQARAKIAATALYNRRSTLAKTQLAALSMARNIRRLVQ